MRSAGMRTLAPVMVAAILLTATAGTTVSAVEGTEEGSLCDVISVDELHSLSPLQYAEPELRSSAFCFYDASPEQLGPHSLNLSLRDVPFGSAFEDFREAVREQFPGIVDVTIGGQQGYADKSFPELPGVIVGIDDSMLSIVPSIGTSDEGQGLDSIDYAMAVAEIIVPRLTGSIEQTQATAIPPTPAVDGVEWTRVSESSGEEITSNDDVGFADLLTGLLDAHGADIEQATLLSANARPENAGDPGGLYVALRISGVEGARLVPGLLDWLSTATVDRAFAAVPATLGGKQATEISLDGETTGFAYATDDTLYLLSFPAELATKVLEQLP
jgi:hypothetical protein